MIAREVTLYQCEHCKKKYLQKHACEKHEKYCWHNPANHYACFDCNFLVKDRTQSDNSYGTYSERTFHCSKLDKAMHSIKAEKINHACLGHTELMPLQCEHRKDDIDTFFEQNPEYGN
jgi:hypothetical protein